MSCRGYTEEPKRSGQLGFAVQLRRELGGGQSPADPVEDSPQREQAGSTTLPWGSENITAQHCTRARTIAVPREQEHQALTVIHLKK